MQVNINKLDNKWPAKYRLVIALNYSHIILSISEEETNTTIMKLVWDYIKNHPFKGWLRTWHALEEYLECNYYLNYILSQADKVQNMNNNSIISNIIQHAWLDIAYGQRDAWPELAGLSIQKLLHLSYYETVAAYEADMQIS